MTDSRWLDPEIERIVDGDPELIELAQRIRSTRPEPPLDPRFQAVLRAQLMREAPAVLGARTAATPRRRRALTPRRGWWQRPVGLAWGGGGLGVALAAAAVLVFRTTPVQDHQVTAISPVAALHAVSPDNVITVAFNEPMNEAAVVAGLHIVPATTVTTAWKGNKLLITPTHHLAGNTPYTVTIDRSATKSRAGQLAASDIRIAFGTAPTPPPAPSVAALIPRGLGPANAGAALVSAGEGSVIVTSSAAFPHNSGGAQATGSASPLLTLPAVSSSPNLSPSAAAAAAPSGEMVLIPSSGNPVDLGPAATAVAVAPDGLRAVASVPVASGNRIEVVPLDGSKRTTIATLAAPVLAVGWLSNDTALVAEPDRILSVDLAGHAGTVTTLPVGTTSVVFAPGGAHAFAGSAAQDGVLIDLGGLQNRDLSGSRQTVAFSGDGAIVSWVDATGVSPRLLTSPVARDTAIAIPLSHPGDSIPAIALDRAGTRIAVVDEPRGGGGSLDVLALPSGSVVARGPDARTPAYSMPGDQIAFISGGSARLAPVPGTEPGTALNLLPDGAAGTLKAFVDAQVDGDIATLQGLSAAGVDAGAATPHGLSRAYVISAASNPDGTVTATARLIVDPSAHHAAASVADESLVLSPSPNGGFVVSSLNAGALHDEPVGPHVVSVDTVSGSTLVLRVSFDSDLQDATVAPAIVVTDRHGHTLDAVTSYDAASRTATITLSVPADTRVALRIASSLVDVNGQALAGLFSTNAGG